MFFGCLPCCGGGGVACPNHENLGIAGPLSVISTARLVQPTGFMDPDQNEPGSRDLLLVDPIDTGDLSGNSAFSFTYQYAEFTGDGLVTPRVLTVIGSKITGTATISTTAQLFLPSRSVSYPYIRLTTRLDWSVGLPTYIATFYEIPCRQNVSPQADDSKTTITLAAESRPGGALPTAPLFSIESAAVHGGALAASAPFPTISANVPRSPFEPAELAFAISGDRSSNPNGPGQLAGAPGSLPWQLSFSAYHLQEPIWNGARVPSTFTVQVSSITDANGASASVSAFAPSYSAIPAGPALIP